MRAATIGRGLALAGGVFAVTLVTSADAMAGYRGYRGGYGYGYRGHGCCSSGQWAAFGLGVAALGGLAYLSTQRSYAPAYYYAPPPAYYYPPAYYAPAYYYAPPAAYYAPAPVPTYYAPQAYAPNTTYYAPQQAPDPNYTAAAPVPQENYATQQNYTPPPGTTNYYAPQSAPAQSYATVANTNTGAAPALPATTNAATLPTYYTPPVVSAPPANTATAPVYNPYAERERAAQQAAGMIQHN